MSNLVQALTTLQYVKGRMPLDSSDNKSTRPDLIAQDPQSQQDRRDRQQAKKNKVDSIRAHHRCPARPQDATPKNVVLYGAFAIAAGAGNCLEMSCASVWYLNESGRFNYDMVYYPGHNAPGQGVRDHIFVAIGQTSDGNGDFPTDFNAWDPDAAICDVWADIACPARDYPARWRARMSNWRYSGLLIANRLPTDDMWSNLVDLPKKSYLQPV
ncbi:hypothetical protein [Viridibacterium curvum]|uniref:Uncharacterized protein n=1 Tax=Viridibacterium curvum TaxID=1101404 RepID=A0ABP9QAT4_9RHOO